MPGCFSRAFFMTFFIFILGMEFLCNFVASKKYSMKKLLIILIATFVQVSCAQTNETAIPADKFKEEIAKPEIILLDVRTPEEYAEGHLANSININYHDENFASKVDSLDKSKQYEVYCRSGKRSAASVKLMQEKGIKNVHDLQGGILEWQAKGLPVTK
jgi:rhodanese-related sulfurtransferase